MFTLHKPQYYHNIYDINNVRIARTSINYKTISTFNKYIIGTIILDHIPDTYMQQLYLSIRYVHNIIICASINYNARCTSLQGRCIYYIILFIIYTYLYSIYIYIITFSDDRVEVAAIG